MKTVVGLYDHNSQAEAAVRELDSSGIASGGVNVVRGGDAMAGTGLVGELVSAGVPERHASLYAQGVSRGGTLVTVSAGDDVAHTATAILNRHNPIDIEQRSSSWMTETASTPTADVTPASTMSVGGESARVGGDSYMSGQDVSLSGADIATPAMTTASTTTGAAAMPMASTTETRNAEGETVLPVVEEEIHVGKREVERGGVRVSTHVEERAVEEQVNLREEHVRVERHAVDRPATSADFNQAFKEETIELTERAEVPVVSKEARVVEEVVVGKEATQHAETIRDTVRRTDVDVQQVNAGEFDRLESDFRQSHSSLYTGNEYAWDEAKPAYRFGYDLAGSNQSGDWNSVETDARQRWEQRSPGTWEKAKNAARHAFDRARTKTNS